MKDKIIAFFMNWMRIEVASAVIIENRGKVLLTKRNKTLPEGGKWCLPGGHLKKWEKAEEGMIREIKEEIGLDVEKSKLLFVHEEFVKRLGLHAEVFVYSVKTKGEIKTNYEVSEVGWFTKKEIEKMELAFTHKQILERYGGDK